MLPIAGIAGMIGNVSGGGAGGSKPPPSSKAEANSDPYTVVSPTISGFESGPGQRGPIITIGGDSRVNPEVTPKGVSWLWIGGGILTILLIVFLIIRR